MSCRILLIALILMPVAPAQDIPLYLFAAPAIQGEANVPQRSEVIDAWTSLSDAFKLNSAMAVPIRMSDRTHVAAAAGLMLALRDARVPAYVHLNMAHPRQAWDPQFVDEVVADTSALGVVVSGLDFNSFPSHDGPTEIVSPPEARWLVETIQRMADRQLRCVIILDELGWLRIMAMEHLRDVYRVIAENPKAVIPIVRITDVHAPGNLAAATGLWAEGAADHWGITAGMRSMARHPYLKGRLAGGDGKDFDANVPAAVAYAALNGAEAYVFDDPQSLWYRDSASWQRYHQPILQKLIDQDIITKRPRWIDHVRVAYQLERAADADAFQLILRDLDPMLAEGYMIRALYRARTIGRFAHYIPDRGNWVPIPVLSPYADEGIAGQTIAPGTFAGVADWAAVIERNYGASGPPDAALVAGVDGARFKLNTSESGGRMQTIHANLAAPINGITADRGDGGVRITWQGRLEDFSYTVKRRALPDGAFEIIAPNHTERSFVDDAPLPAAAYTVTAITSATQNLAYTLGPGHAWITLPGESIALTEVALPQGAKKGVARPRTAQPLFISQVGEGGAEVPGPARTLERLANAIATENLDEAMSTFSEDYRDPQGWGRAYVRRALQLLFEESRHTRFDYEMRRVSAGEASANVYAYVRFSGATNPNGSNGTLIMPATAESTSWITFEEVAGDWQILGSNPAIVNMRDLIRSLSQPHSHAILSTPDRYEQRP